MTITFSKAVQWARLLGRFWSPGPTFDIPGLAAYFTSLMSVFHIESNQNCWPHFSHHMLERKPSRMSLQINHTGPQPKGLWNYKIFSQFWIWKWRICKYSSRMINISSLKRKAQNKLDQQKIKGKVTQLNLKSEVK